MAIVRELKGFVFRKRQLKWLVVAALIALVGHALDPEPEPETKPVLNPLVELTRSVKASLEQVQPFRIAGYYSDASQRHEGIWLGQWVDDFLHPDFDRHSDGGVVMLLRASAGVVLATPAVAVRVWQETGYYGRILFAATVLLIFLLMRLSWKDSDSSDNGGGAFLTTVALIGFGPWIAGAIYWLALHILIICVIVFGQVLAGLISIVATFSGVYVATMHIVHLAETSDKVEEVSALIKEEISEWKRD